MALDFMDHLFLTYDPGRLVLINSQPHYPVHDPRVRVLSQDKPAEIVEILTRLKAIGVKHNVLQIAWCVAATPEIMAIPDVVVSISPNHWDFRVLKPDLPV